jgi:hypothetical protein
MKSLQAFKSILVWKSIAEKPLAKTGSLATHNSLAKTDLLVTQDSSAKIASDAHSYTQFSPTTDA